MRATAHQLEAPIFSTTSERVLKDYPAALRRGQDRFRASFDRNAEPGDADADASDSQLECRRAIVTSTPP